ncbi:MAG: PIN domain-containing protein [Gammaproteobacteria bacterium]
MILIDSDVLVWLTRGHAGAKSRLAQIDPWRISTVTYLELAQGCRSKDELQRAKRGLALQRTEILPLTPMISELAAALVDAHALADGLQLADALIAATALEHNLVLLTGNTKHFRVIGDLKIERFEP